MLFKRKDKKLILRALTTNESLAKLYFPKTADIPKWITDQPGTYEPDKHWGGVQDKILSIRNCPAITGIYKNSFHLPIWADYTIATEKSKKVSFNSFALAESHHDKQLSGGFEGWVNCKLLSPWYFIDEVGPRPWLWQEDTYSLQDIGKMRVLPGKTEFFYQHSTHINMMLPIPLHDNSVWETKIKNGDNLILMTPLIEGEWSIIPEVVTELEMAKYHRWNFQQLGNYQRMVQRWEMIVGK